jgi:predicted peroxiredoxin
MARRLVLRLSHGPGDVERVGGALTVGSAAVASGVAVELWLSNDGVELGKPGVVESLRLEHSAPLIDLWTAIGATGSVFACTQCLLRRGIAAEELREGVTQAGAAALVASVAEEGAVALDF